MAVDWCRRVDCKHIFLKLPIYLSMHHSEWERNEQVRRAVRNAEAAATKLKELNRHTHPARPSTSALAAAPAAPPSVHASPAVAAARDHFLPSSCPPVPSTPTIPRPAASVPTVSTTQPQPSTPPCLQLPSHQAHPVQTTHCLQDWKLEGQHLCRWPLRWDTQRSPSTTLRCLRRRWACARPATRIYRSLAACSSVLRCSSLHRRRCSRVCVGSAA
jgi:hypothetical protein